MRKLITDIAERCHATATKRGKDTSRLGCVADLCGEAQEFWAAISDWRTIPYFNETINHIQDLSDNDFCVEYEMRIHNTDLDELADIVITAATWFQTIKQSEGYNAEYLFLENIDAYLISGALNFVANRIAGPERLAQLYTIVRLKMRYNELRNN